MKFGVCGWGGGCVVCAWLALSPGRVNAQTADALEILSIPAQVPAGSSFSVTIRGLLPGGALAGNWNSQLRLRSFAATAAPAVISEIDWSGETIEITNPSPLPADLSNWELQALGDYGGVTLSPNARLRFPQGSVLPPQGSLTWTSRGTPPGAYPNFVSAKRFNPSGVFRLARLYDRTGRFIDEVYFRTSASSPEDALWKGTGLGAYPTNVTYQRVGYANHFRSVDWVTNTPTLGLANAGLTLPWTDTGTWSAASPAIVQVTNGIWTGSVALPQARPGTQVLKADDGAGVAGTSMPFSVIPAPPLQLTVVAGSQTASEAQAGTALTVTASTPALVSSNLAVTLTLSDSDEFALPSQVIISAGSNVVQFTVTNLDDPIADGAARITLTAQAGGYADGILTLVNADDESGFLTVIVPSQLKEDSGFALEPGRVFLNEPARHDVLIELSADAPVEVPSQLIIPAGQLSQSFFIRVGDDPFVNQQNWEARVRAVTPTWPTAEGVIRLIDDEDAGFSASLPPLVVEGTSEPGRIQVRTAHAVDTVFTLTSNTPRIQVPTQVTVLAGALSAEFEVRAPDNPVTDGQVTAQLCLETGGQSAVCRPITVADDEVNISALEVGIVPEAVFAGQPFPFSASLVDAAGTAQRTNVTGQVELLASPLLVQLSGLTNPVPLINGYWSNSISVQGEALDAQLGVSAAGYQSSSRRFDVLPGREVAITFNDAVWHGGLGRFLVAEPPQTNAPARLTEIDPQTGQRGRSLALPRAARRVAISGDGAVAWLASSQSTLQRVDVAAWQFDREYPVYIGTTNTDPRDLVVLPGEPERVVVVANINNTGWQVMLFDHGAGFSNRAPLPGSIASLALTAGRNASEVFCQSFGFLSKFLIASNAVSPALSTGISSSSIKSPSLALGDGLLYRGYGEVYDPDTLATVSTFATLNSVVGCLFTDRGIILFAEQNGILQAYDLGSSVAQGSHSLPPSVGDPVRLMRWGVRGLASFTSARTNLVIFETPLGGTNAPDLVLTANVPAAVVLPTNPGLPVTFLWQFGVTNRGAAAAPGAQLQLDSGERFDLGSLAPGDGTVIAVERGSSIAEVVSARATARCAVPDALPQDNSVTVATRVMKPDLPNSRQLILGMTHLIVSPGGDRLYASVAKTAGDVEDGVAVIDPETATVEKMLPVGPNPQRLAISGDGSRLYALLGTNTLVRWNLLTGTGELSISFTNETVLDFLALPGSATSLVVATTVRIAIFDDAQPRPGSFNAATDRRYLGYAGGLLWVAEPGWLRSFTLTANGLSTGTSTAFTLFSDYYRFASDGPNLYFSGAVFDTVSRQIVSSSFLGDNFFPEPASASLFSPVGACLRSYSLTNYALRAEQCLPQATSAFLQDPVRWGADGLAVRCAGQQLILVRSALVPTSGAGNLAVSILAPTQPRIYTEMQWVIAITNNSAQSMTGSLMIVTLPDDFTVTGLEGPPGYRWGNQFYAELDQLTPGSSVTVLVRGWSGQSNVSVSARIVNASDVNPSDNYASVSVYAGYPLADLALQNLNCPPDAPVGTEFDMDYVLTNAGPEPAGNSYVLTNSSPGVIRMTALTLTPDSSLEIVSVSCTNCIVNASLDNILLPEIAPGDSESVKVRFRPTLPGLFSPSAYVAGINDPQPLNNGSGCLSFASPPGADQALTELNFPGVILAWDRSRQQVLAAFPNDSGSLFVLAPTTLAPVASVRLPGLPEFIAPCNDGRHAWVSLAGGAGAQVDLDALIVTRQFPYDPLQTPVWFIATPPGQPQVLLAAIDPGFLGNNRVRIFDDGMRRPGEYGPLGWAGRGVPILFTPDGRLLLAASQVLRELSLTRTGFSLVRNLDYAGLYSGLGLSYASNRLFFSEGRVIKLDTGTVDDTLLSHAPLVADDETGWAYTGSGSRILFGGGPMTLRALSARTLAPLWRLEVPVPYSDVGAIVPMGTNGVLFIGDRIRLVKPALFGLPIADLTLSASAPAIVDGPGLNFPIQFAVTNRAVWTASGSELAVELSDGLLFADGGPGAGTNRLTLSLGDLDGGTNVTLQARAVTNGNFAIHARVTNSLPQSATGTTTQELALTVLAPPVFFLDNTSVAEGSSARPGLLTGWLSRPAPVALTVGVTVGLLSAQADDFNSLTGQFQFSAGQQKAVLSTLIKGDAVPEPDETATLSFSSAYASLARTTALLTILNDDWPRVTVTNVSVVEGNSGRTNAAFRITLSTKAPFPVEILFRTIPGTASANLDFIPREGWVRFEANEDVKTVFVPVIGDLAYELAETAVFVLLDKTNAELASAQGILTIRNDDLPPAPVLTVTALSNGGLRLDFDTVNGATYGLQTRTNLTLDAWKLFPTSVKGSGAPASLILPPPASAETYYRLQAQ